MAKKKKSTKKIKPFIIVLLSIAVTFFYFLEPLANRNEGVIRQTSLGNAYNIRKKTKIEKSILLNDESVKNKLNDPEIIKSWGLTGRHSNSHVHASRAWNIWWEAKKKKQVSDVIVAVIDTGIDILHEDITNNLWVNKGESGLDSKGRDKSRNKIDDDGNGFIDDVHGWNFVAGNNNLTDNHGHGTHVSGILGAEGGNGVGLSGVVPKVKIMTLKYYDPKSKSNNNLLNTIKSIRYATKMGAQIINYSGGGTEFSKQEYEAIKHAKNKGTLFIAAAGNEKSNSDRDNYYPANYGLDNIISVTAINTNTDVLASSNWGVKTVHLAAPGSKIRSTLPNNRYGVMTGTSQATAFVTGVAALLFSLHNNFDYLQVKDRILSTAQGYQSKGLLGKTKTAGRLNSWAALAMQPRIPLSGVITEGPTPVVEPSTFESNNSNNLQDLKNLLSNKILNNKK